MFPGFVVISGATVDEFTGDVKLQNSVIVVVLVGEVEAVLDVVVVLEVVVEDVVEVVIEVNVEVVV